jgi:predicted ATPase/DNA-binding XRE family transcriptional regulator/uncharacterized protein HemY
MLPGDEGAHVHAPPIFKDLLRRFRLEAGLSQEALAERAHLSVRAISDLERGVKQWPRPETLQLLAEALNLAPQDRAAMAAAARRPSSPRIPPDAGQPRATPIHGTAPSFDNLPVQVTSFIGREREQAEVIALLEAHHVITIAGLGGAGKTRLALQVAGRLAASYPDGVWQVELARLGSTTLVPQAIASVLGLREQPGITLPVTIVEHLKSRQVLLVLDNCEHLISACAEMVSDLVRGCPRLRVLTTSREGLRVPGETIYRMPPLSLPDPDQAAGPDQLLAFEAVQLFVERARERRVDFTLTEANAGAVAQICRRLDGIPLAIELAAARIAVLTAEGIAGHLGDAFHLLTSGPRAVQPRHQTLRAALDWSHDLLSEHEQVLLRRLSVFLGGWTLEAAEDICAGDLSHAPCFASEPTGGAYPALMSARTSQPEPLGLPHGPSPRHADRMGEEMPNPAVMVSREEVLDLLDELVNKSLVLMEDVGQIAWYRLLETVRQYECEGIQAAGEMLLIRDRHLAWYVALAAEAEQGLTGAEQGAWLSRLDREHDNVRAALAWSLHAPARHAAGMELAARLKLFWEIRGHLTEGRRWLEDLLARAAVAPPVVRARALQCAGILAINQGDYERASNFLEESLALQRELADRQGIAMALQALGVVALYHGDYRPAVTLFEENLALRREIGDPWGIAAALGNLGQAVFLLGDNEQAILLHEEALTLRRDLGNKRGIAESLNELGLVAWSRRDYDQAAALHEESLALRRELGHKGGIAVSLSNLAEVKIAQGAYDPATELLEQSLELSQVLGDKQVIAYCLEGLATIAAVGGAPRRAAELFGAAEALRERIGLPLPPPARANYDQSTAAARAALGEDAFVASWSQGRALPPDRAVALALAPAGDARVAVELPVAGSPGR